MKSNKGFERIVFRVQEINGDPLVELMEIIRGKELSGFLITRTKPVKYVWKLKSGQGDNNEPKS